jgi:uncharacterized protein YjbI with pentapeptide repeats
MIDSPRDQPTIAEVLAAFVREHAPAAASRSDPVFAGPQQPPATDIQAAVTVLGRRPARRSERGRVNMTRTKLTGADLFRANLIDAFLYHANLSSAKLTGANLKGANLTRADLSGLVQAAAYMDNGNLNDANLTGADLTGVTLTDEQRNSGGYGLGIATTSPSRSSHILSTNCSGKPGHDQVDLPGLHFHDLRHTGGTLTAATGATLKELMARLGHSSVRAALIYQHATRDRDQAIAQALGTFVRDVRNAAEKQPDTGEREEREA